MAALQHILNPNAPSIRFHFSPTVTNQIHRNNFLGFRLSPNSKCPLQKVSIANCTASSNVDLSVESRPEVQQKPRFCFSSNGWSVLRVDHEDLPMLQQFSQVQAEAFHKPVAVFNDFFFAIFKAEVLSSLLYKIRNAGPNRFACFAAIPESSGDDTAAKVVGVVDAAAMADQQVLKCLPGVDEYLYLSGMAVDVAYRRRKIASSLLQACDLTAVEWGFEYLVLQAYEDDRAARLLYAKAGYDIISIDPLWLSKFFGKRRRVVLAKKAANKSGSVFNPW